MTNTFIDIVKLVETPNPDNPFYVVESTKGKHYVSGLGGRAAMGLKIGTQLKLFKSETKHMSIYQLERV